MKTDADPERTPPLSASTKGLSLSLLSHAVGFAKFGPIVLGPQRILHPSAHIPGTRPAKWWFFTTFKPYIDP